MARCVSLPCPRFPSQPGVDAAVRRRKQTVLLATLPARKRSKLNFLSGTGPHCFLRSASLRARIALIWFASRRWRT